jgi:hypothetical protein
MSLINDALKKAQRERTGSADQPLPAAPAGTTAGGRPAGHAAAPARSLWPIAVAALALVGGGTAVWFLKPTAPAPVTVAANVQPAASTSPVATVPSDPAPAPGVAVATIPATPAPAPEPVPLQLHINLPSTPPTTAPTPGPVAQPAPPPVVPAAPTPAVAPADTAAPAAPFQVTLQLEDPRILAFLDGAAINGIRIAADDAKLLMNKKVFRTGDVVDRDLGLKLTTIRPNELIFEDKRGIQYRKAL